MAFRKTVTAKSLDLLKTVFGEFRRVAARDHVADHLVFELADGADIAKRRHRAAQAVGFLGRELCGLDRDPHRLLLEQRHAERLVQHLVQFIRRTVLGRRRRIVLLLDAVSPPQVRMHHVALDRPGPHDRHFNDEIVEGARLQARQHVHLRAAFDLEHAEQFTAAQHVVDLLRRPARRWRAPSARPCVRRSDQNICGCRSACPAPARRPSSYEARRRRPCPIR